MGVVRDTGRKTESIVLLDRRVPRCSESFDAYRAPLTLVSAGHSPRMRTRK
jgi:hypothetical protein